MMKKLFPIIVLVILVSLSACNSEPKNNVNSSNLITISENGFFEIEDCVERGLKDKYIMLESKYCGHCKKTLPDFKEACEEKGFTPIILDVSIDEQRLQMESYGIDIRFTPTFILNCEYFVGAKSKEEYVQLLEIIEVNN